VSPGLGAAGRRRTNLALAVLLAAAVLSGLVAQAVGTDLAVDPALVHGVVALAVLVLAPWKQVIVRRGLATRWRRLGWKWLSLVLLALVVVTIVSGLAHATGLVRTIGPLTVMQVHVSAAVLASMLAIDHYRRHPVRPRQVDLDRRTFLRATAVIAGAGAAWVGLEGLIGAGRLPGGDRRFTGSHERGSFDPAAMPTTS
jgi:4-amino-4-deoxy-L-arabinose transferase-like glycosyltransferase